MKNLYRIQYISDGITFVDQENNIKKALDSGITWIQLRWKNADGKLALYQLAEKTKRLCEEYKAVFIVNDTLTLAQHLDADGVHLGLQDESVRQARKLLGPLKIIGGTANSYSDVLQRVIEKCDYIGLGPMRFTKTKANLSPILGISGFQMIMEKLKKEKINHPPIYAIGGIEETDIQNLLSAGIYGIAISSLVQKKPYIISNINQHYEQHLKNC